MGKTEEARELLGLIPGIELIEMPRNRANSVCCGSSEWVSCTLCNKQIQLETSSPPLAVEADEQLFRQALFNLLLNAVQAVEPGGQIQVRWHVSESEGGVIEVCDNGPGVAAADRVEIFKPYVTKRPKGVGLGLAIVQQIVAAHRWEIVCLPREPRGAVFRLSHLRPAS